MNYEELISLVEQEKITSMSELIDASNMPYLEILDEFQNNGANDQYNKMFEMFRKNYAEK